MESRVPSWVGFVVLEKREPCVMYDILTLLTFVLTVLNLLFLMDLHRKYNRMQAESRHDILLPQDDQQPTTFLASFVAPQKPTPKASARRR
jgi:hypothetical protein